MAPRFGGALFLVEGAAAGQAGQSWAPPSTRSTWPEM